MNAKFRLLNAVQIFNSQELSLSSVEMLVNEITTIANDMEGEFVSEFYKARCPHCNGTGRLPCPSPTGDDYTEIPCHYCNNEEPEMIGGPRTDPYKN